MGAGVAGEAAGVPPPARERRCPKSPGRPSGGNRPPARLPPHAPPSTIRSNAAPPARPPRKKKPPQLAVLAGTGGRCCCCCCCCCSSVGGSPSQKKGGRDDPAEEEEGSLDQDGETEPAETAGGRAGGRRGRKGRGDGELVSEGGRGGRTARQERMREDRRKNQREGGARARRPFGPMDRAGAALAARKRARTGVGLDAWVQTSCLLERIFPAHEFRKLGAGGGREQVPFSPASGGGSP